MDNRVKRPTWVIIAVMALIPLLMVLGNSVLIPGLPQMQVKMHITKFQVSLIITLFSVPAGIVIPFAGFLSDRISRKWIVVPCLLLFGTGGVIAGLAAWFVNNPYWLVLVGRVIQGVGASGTAPIAMAWIGDLFSGSDRSRVLGINEAGNAFGKVVSPVIGSIVALIAWYSVFFIFPVLCLPLAAAVWWLLPDKKPNENHQSVADYVKSLGQIAKREGRWLGTSYIAGSAALFTLFGVLFYLSDLLETKYHIDGVPKGLVLAIPLVALSTTSFVTGSLIKKRKALMKWLVVAGFAVLCASLVCGAWIANNAWMLVGIMSVGAIGTGLVLPCLNMFITSAVAAEKRGIVTSFYGSVRFLGVAFGPPVFTWLLSISKTVMFLTVAGVTACCSLLAAWLIRPEPTPPESGRHPNTPSPPIPARHKARA